MLSLCAIPVLGSLLSGCLHPALATGYVEGEYVLVAPVDTATIDHVAVRRGDEVAVGDALATMEKQDAEIAVAQAESALARAESNLANISLGRRPEEIAVIEALLASAEAQAEGARREFARQQDLFDRGIASQSAYDLARTNHDIAVARVNETRANLEVARLPARPDEIAAAKAAVGEARSALENARWRLAKRTLTALSAGTVFDVIRNRGEVAGPQAPVLSILPRGAIKLRLYVPEPDLSSIAIGTELAVECDGCAPGILARVSYVSPDPEYTPPVIYSLENRQKLVYLVEARMDPDRPQLRPGQIVSVMIAGKAP
jgi:HlyD family secretion protein